MTSFIRKFLYSSPQLKRMIKDMACIVRREPKITWDPISDKQIIELIGKDDPIILDIGCNDGTHTKWFLALFERARIYSFEPDPRARKRFLKQINDDRAVLFDLAISNLDGVRDFYVSSGFAPDGHDFPNSLSEEWDQSGSIRKPKIHLEKYPWCKFDEKISVTTKKLDSWAKDEGVLEFDLIWADVQGAEIDLIKGGQEVLRHTRYFYTEYSDTELYEGQINFKHLLALLPEFELVCRYEKDVLLKNKSLV